MKKDSLVRSQKDIVAEKLWKITGTATKKDFVDLYFLAKNHFTFEKMFKFYDKVHQNFSTNKITLLKALCYFEDANNADMPEMIRKVEWGQVKKFLQKEVIRLANKYI